MTATLVIFVDMTDEDDFDWVRTRCVAAVEDAVSEIEDDGKIDGTLSVSWKESVS